MLSANICSICLALTHWGRDKIDAILQTTCSNAFSWMKIFEFRLKFHWSLFLKVQFTIFQHWFRQWLGAEQATSHYLNQWWPSSMTHICVTRPQWVKSKCFYHFHCNFWKKYMNKDILCWEVGILFGAKAGTCLAAPGHQQLRYWLDNGKEHPWNEELRVFLESKSQQPVMFQYWGMI